MRNVQGRWGCNLKTRRNLIFSGSRKNDQGDLILGNYIPYIVHPTNLLVEIDSNNHARKYNLLIPFINRVKTNSLIQLPLPSTNNTQLDSDPPTFICFSISFIY